MGQERAPADGNHPANVARSAAEERCVDAVRRYELHAVRALEAGETSVSVMALAATRPFAAKRHLAARRHLVSHPACCRGRSAVAPSELACVNDSLPHRSLRSPHRFCSCMSNFAGTLSLIVGCEPRSATRVASNASLRPCGRRPKLSWRLLAERQITRHTRGLQSCSVAPRATRLGNCPSGPSARCSRKL